MEKQELLKQFSKQEEKLLIAKVLDKIKFVHQKNGVQTTDFLDEYEQNSVSKALSLIKEKSYILDGGYDNARKKNAIFIF